jgi:hypothetical protein
VASCEFSGSLVGALHGAVELVVGFLLLAGSLARSLPVRIQLRQVLPQSSFRPSLPGLACQ